MKDFQKTLKELRELSTINEETKALLEKMTGKELVDYESIDALVGALMTHYNGELKKKATTSHSHTWLEVTSKPTTFPPSSHNHDERYYTEEEIDTKFKNLSLVPTPVGGILMMYNNINPAELYSGTTWELLATDKYLKTTTGTPLATGGSNSFTIQKTNLPAEKLQVEAHSMTRGTMNITGDVCDKQGGRTWGIISDISGATGAFARGFQTNEGYAGYGQVSYSINFNASRSWTGSTSSASPYTSAMGSGTPLTINPEYITIRAWKRLS